MNAGWIGSWTPGIGDPTWGGWLTVMLYAVAAWLCHRVLRVHRSRPLLVDRSERQTWNLIFILLVLLGINKQLDLQSALTEMGRLLAHGQGWYESRRDVQLAFISALMILGATALVAVLVLVWNAHPATHWAVAGCGLLAVFVVVRASSFHRVDTLINAEWNGLRHNWMLEMGALLWICAAARRRARARSRARS